MHHPAKKPKWPAHKLAQVFEITNDSTQFHQTKKMPLGKKGYLVMELIEGRTLQDLLSDGSLPETEILRLGGQLADGLTKAHEAGRER